MIIFIIVIIVLVALVLFLTGANSGVGFGIGDEAKLRNCCSRYRAQECPETLSTVCPDGNILLDLAIQIYYDLEQVRASSLPSILYPKKYHIEARRNDMVLKLDIYILDVCEIV